LASTTRPDEKLAALREQGALNPRPQTVTDQIFATHDFFDPRDLVQVKYEMLRRVQAEGKPAAHAAASFGFSRQSFYQARAAFAQGGLPALLPRRRGPHGPHKLRDEVLDFLEQVRDENPKLRSVELVKRVQEEFGLTVHPRSIERGLARHGKKTSSPSP
jgi:transposase